MFISFVLNLEYFNQKSRVNWFLKNLYLCHKYGWALITYESLRSYIDEIKNHIQNDFFTMWETLHFKWAEVENTEVYYIPDQILIDKEKELGSRTAFISYLYESEYPELNEWLVNTFSLIKKNNPNKQIKGVLNCLETPLSIKNVCQEWNIPVISYVFSAIRKAHGYNETLYIGTINNNLYCTNDCKSRFEKFKKENFSIPVLENCELLALFGKVKNFPLIKLLDYEPSYELLVCGECFRFVPYINGRVKYTDDDIFFECNDLFAKNEIITRQHSLFMDQIKIERSHVRNDPASTILSSKRMTAVNSQITLKGMLWNRTVIMKKDCLPHSFMCEKVYDSTKRVDLLFLNYYLFCYLIPNGLMFDDEYLKWRLLNPSEKEIYQYHMRYYNITHGLTSKILDSTDNEERFKSILSLRGADEFTISKLFDPSPIRIVFEYATSRFDLLYDNYTESKWTLNVIVDNSFVSEYDINIINTLNRIQFSPLDDRAGYASINSFSIFIEDKLVLEESLDLKNLYLEKNTGNITLPFDFESFLGKTIKLKVYWNV